MKTDVEFLDKLIRIPSVSSDIAQVNVAMDAMRDYLEAHGVACVMETTEGRNVLYASTRPGKEQDYLLNAHLDVVPAEPGLFIPRIEDGKMFGRGTDDCKGCALAIAQILCELNGKASVGAVFTADEEIGGLSTKYMVEQGYKARKLVIILDAAAYAIATAEKGVLDLALRATGKAVHSSRPWGGVNAIDLLIEGYSKLKAAWPQNTPGKDGDVWFDTMAATIINAGTAHNKVPDVAEMLINIRFTKPGDEDRIAEFVRKTTGLEVIRHETCIPVFCDENTPAIKNLRAAMEKAWPEKTISTYKMCGATDARHFAAAEAPIAILGVDGEDCHTDGEWVRIDGIADVAEMLAKYLAE